MNMQFCVKIGDCMKNIKNAAVVVQNFIQYESFVGAIDIMIKQKIDVTIFVPIEKNDPGFKNMFDTTYDYLKNNTNYKIKREYEPTEYFDLLFMVAPIYQYLDLKRKYTIKYMYGYTTKPWYSASPHVNNVFDIILTYGESESFLKAYSELYPIGNIKYLNFKKNKNHKENEKKNLLYLPTYGEDTNIEKVVSSLNKIKKKYNLSIKAHHGTNYLENAVERNRKKLIEDNFDNIYTSEDSILELLKDADVVISDNSGAIWDAVCSGTPVVISNYDLKEKDYQGFVAEHYKAIKNKDILVINEQTNIDEVLEQSLSIEMRKKQRNLFKKLFICDNENSGKYFDNFLHDLDNNKIYSYEEYCIQQRKKEYIRDLINEKEKLTIENNDLKYRCNELSRELDNEQKKYDNFENDIYNSTSWKITKPIRKLKMILLSAKKER